MFMPRTLIALVLLATTAAHATNDSAASPRDERLRTVVYHANDVVPVTASFHHAVFIDLGRNNKVVDIFAGETETWAFDLNATQDGIFVKPVDWNADTNLIVRTENRTYYFDLRSDQSKTEEPTYGLRFIYPEDELARLKAQTARVERTNVTAASGGTATDPASWNLDYVWKGDGDTAPRHAFDDGTFTYLAFDPSLPTPAIFAVDSEQRESVLNFHVKGRYIVVEGVYRQLTLRNGDVVTCLFNDRFPVDNAPGMNGPEAG